MQCQATQQSSTDYLQVGAGLVAVRTCLEGAPESLYCVVRSCISWQFRFPLTNVKVGYDKKWYGHEGNVDYPCILVTYVDNQQGPCVTM